MDNKKADVVIIGGGIIGCAIAYELSKQHVSIIVIEKASRVGTEASWAGAGILTSHASTHEPYPELCRASLAMYPNLASENNLATRDVGIGHYPLDSRFRGNDGDCAGMTGTARE